MAAATEGIIPVGIGLIICLAQTSLPIKVATYKAPTYQASISPMLIVHHGIQRNYEEYRDFAMTLADQTGALVLSPEFDRERFPGQRYTMQDADVNRKEHWPSSLLTKIIEEVKIREAREELPHYIMAHSGGSQSVIRSLYLHPACNASGILLANAGSWLFPLTELAFPYGLGGLEKNDDALHRYLSLPLVISVGTHDIKDGNNFDTSPGAMAQGGNRLDRGRAMYAAGHRVASLHGWECAWKLIEVPGVGHDGGGMLKYEKVGPALFGEEKYAFYSSKATAFAKNNNITLPAGDAEEEIEADGKHHPRHHQKGDGHKKHHHKHDDDDG